MGQKQSHGLVTIILSVLTDSRIFFTGRFLGKFAVKWISKIPPRLAFVATLPCDLSLMACFAVMSEVRHNSSNSFSSVSCLVPPLCWFQSHNHCISGQDSAIGDDRLSVRPPVSTVDFEPTELSNLIFLPVYGSGPQLAEDWKSGSQIKFRSRVGVGKACTSPPVSMVLWMTSCLHITARNGAYAQSDSIEAAPGAMSDIYDWLFGILSTTLEQSVQYSCLCVSRQLLLNWMTLDRVRKYTRTHRRTDNPKT